MHEYVWGFLCDHCGVVVINSDLNNDPGKDCPIQPRTRKELHQAAIELMKKKHRDMGFIEDVIR